MNTHLCTSSSSSVPSPSALLPSSNGLGANVALGRKRSNGHKRTLVTSTTIAAALMLSISSVAATSAAAQNYTALDDKQRPVASNTILPASYLRGYDPVTVYFKRDVGRAFGPADDGAKRLKISPTWPGAYQWLDKRTLQFRPAEPWPALSRFSIVGAGKQKVLTTMMSAPSAMSPPDGSKGLPPFRSFSLTFAQPISVAALKNMLHVEVRQAPGIASSRRVVVDDIEITPLPRSRVRDPQAYAFTMRKVVPEDHELVVELSLALDDKDKVMWTGRARTKPAFHLASITCGSQTSAVNGGGGTPKEQALDCGHSGEAPQLIFSADVGKVGLSQLKRLVKLSPSVPDLHFTQYGKRVLLRGRFLPDTLYRIRIEHTPILDDTGRRLTSLTPGVSPEVFFYLGYKRPFVRWMQGRGMLEKNGPRMMPVRGYGDRRADLRIHRIDPMSTKLWPFPESPIVINEERPPPFPGEEPGVDSFSGSRSVFTMSQHIRLLGSPLVSAVTELPLIGRAGVTDFGLDLGDALDDVVGKNRPGHYLVGLRRLQGAPQRSWVRVQITNLSLTTVEEGDQVVFFVRRIDNAQPVAGAKIRIEGLRRTSNKKDERLVVTDSKGRAVLSGPKAWSRLVRLSVTKDDDTLVIDPNEPPPKFANFHWSRYGSWLSWLTQTNRAKEDAKDTLAFVVTDRPIYRPGDKVNIVGWVRVKDGGVLSPANVAGAKIRLKGPGGKSYDLAATISPLGSVSATFQDKKAPTGSYTASILLKKSTYPIGRRQFRFDAYRTPKFEVQVAGPTRTRLDGPFSVKAFARYYAGGNVAGAQISWKVTQRRYYHVPKGREGFIFASSSQFARSQSSGRTGVDRSTGTLDDKGAMSLEINPALDINGSARTYRIEATVTGADNQTVSSVHEVRALPAFTLGLKLPRFLPKAGDIAPKIIATDVNDKGLAGQTVTVKLFRRSWHSHLRETHFATGEASYVTEQEDTLLIEKKVRTTKGPLKVSLPVNVSGVYVVELLARDKLGRVQTLRADLFVGGKEGVAWRKSQHGVFELSTDKRNYVPGDTAQILIKSPFAKGQALVVIERAQGNEYRFVDVRGSKAIVPVRITADVAPNLPFHVVLMRGRIASASGKSKKDDSRYRPQTVASSIDIRVKPVANQLKVKVEHQKTVQPGSKVPFKISLRDPNGRPVAGEVTLWLVDEAVLSLATEGPLNPLSTFVVANTRRSSIRDTRNSMVGRLAEEEESPGGDGMADSAESAMRSKKISGRGMGKSRRRVRRNFATVPYYATTLKIGPSGTKTVSVTMSDDLTNFNVRAIAVSGKARFGHTQNRIRVRLPVLVQPQLPRFARIGDRFSIGGVARVVEGDGGPGSVDITVTGPVDGRIRPRAVTLDANKAVSVTWPISIRSTAGATSLKVKMGVTRKSDGLGDSFEVSVPIYPDRATEKTLNFFSLKAAAGKNTSTSLPTFSETPRAGTVEQVATFTTVKGLLPAVVGVQALVEYPHGCLEQKLSKLLPQVELANFASSVGVRKSRPDVVDAVSRLVAEMELHQDSAGLFSYWPGGPTDVALTAQALEFFVVAKNVGVNVPRPLQDKATSALRRVLRSDFEFLRSYRYNQQTSALAALARRGKLDEHYLIGLFHDRKKMDATASADLLRTMAYLPARMKQSMQDNIKTLVDDTWARVVFTQERGKIVFDRIEDGRPRWDFGYLGSSTSSLAAVLESLSLHDGGHPRLPLLRTALLARATENGFGTTHDNRRAVTAIIRSLQSTSEGAVRSTSSTISFGRERVSLGPQQKIGHANVDEKTKKLQSKGTKETYALLRRTFLPQKPGDRVGALAKGFVVSRSFEVYPKAGGKRRYDDQRGQERELSIGDVVELSTTLVVSKAQHHVALVVPFAAGLEPLNPALKSSGSDAVASHSDTRKPTYVQRLDHEVRFYFDYLPAGTHSFHFRTRATVEGSFTHPPPLAEGMYAPEIRGRGVGQRFIVGPAKK